ncbi:sialidase family protein [uncultured Legionella sp.]|uniref:sialidase family protein n=1 Tax=uncultured Legionella sp. TaxID=210934 RepID=UPI00262CF517|nr:sialidase family protein [uncultured Legionella sp.]
MKNYMSKTPYFLCATAVFLFNNPLNAAGISPIDINLSSGKGTNNITIAKGQVAVVEYEIKDNIGRPPERTWLWALPTLSYITRTQSINQPDCTNYNQPNRDPNSFSLPPNGHCYFAFQIDGTLFDASKSTTATYRPLFSNSSAISYGPCEDEKIHITLSNVVDPVIAPLVAAGYYNDGEGIQRPLLVASQDSGNNWTYPQYINAPEFTAYPFTDFGEFNSTSCNGNICIAAGSYCTGECGPGYKTVIADELHPLLALSNNSGITWSYPKSITSPEFTDNLFFLGFLSSASCSSNTCIAAGEYEDMNNIKRPLLALTQDSGATWKYPESLTSPIFTPADTYPFADGGLVSSSCNGTLCITGGYYNDQSSNARPLLAVSKDSGSTWSFPASITSPTYSDYKNYGYFTRVTCNGNTCIAVGDYVDTNDIFRPLLALTKNSGDTWNYAEITAPVFSPASPYPFASGSFASVSCKGDLCVAVGFYIDTSDVKRPLLALTNNAGDTWSFPESITTPELTISSFTSGGFTDVSCNNSICIATGSFRNTSNDIQPLLALSKDSGSTWSYSVPITTPVFTPLNTYPFYSGEFNSASCNETTCIAAGTYVDDDGRQRPLLALSTDSGSIWSYPEVITSVLFSPMDTNPYADEGRFRAASAGSPSLLPDSLKFILSNRVQEKHKRYEPKKKELLGVRGR